MPVYKDKKIKGKDKWYYVINDKGAGKSGRLKKRGFAKKELAEAEMVDVMDQLNKGTFIKPSIITLQEYFVEFLESKKDKITETTLEHYKYQAGVICEELGYYTLPEVTVEIIEQTYRDWLQEGYAPGTVLNLHSLLSGCLNRARIRKKIRENPALLVENLPKIEQKELVVWTKDQCITFLDAVRKSRFYIAFLLAMTTGLRQTEILGLRWQDINLENQTFHVQQIVSHDGKEILPRTKTKKSKRLIPFPPELLPVLNAQKARINIEKMKNKNIYTDLDLIICTKLGNQTKPRGLVQCFDNFKEKVSLPNVPFHRLRHAYTSMLGEIEIMPQEVAEFLGHKKVDMSMHYTHVYDDKLKLAAAKFGKYFFGEEVAK